LTANAGGDTIALSKLFKRVVSIELDPVSFLCLVYNIRVALQIRNVLMLNKNSVKVCRKLVKTHGIKYAFIDPVWGLDYKEREQVTLSLDTQSD
jgi:hypothetical protein